MSMRLGCPQSNATTHTIIIIIITIVIDSKVSAKAEAGENEPKRSQFRCLGAGSTQQHGVDNIICDMIMCLSSFESNTTTASSNKKNI